MIIIKKAPSEIKRFCDAVMKCDTTECFHNVQDYYSESCILFERDIIASGGTYLFTRSEKQVYLPVSMILSSDKKKVIVSKFEEIQIRLYQLRSKDRSTSEDILVEPFYPGFRTTLYDIYGILAEKPRASYAGAYRFSSTHSLRIRRNIRERFRTMLPDWFSHELLIPMSFEEFYRNIHLLSSERLRAIFKAPITFVIPHKNI